MRSPLGGCYLFDSLGPWRCIQFGPDCLDRGRLVHYDRQFESDGGRCECGFEATDIVDLDAVHVGW